MCSGNSCLTACNTNNDCVEGRFCRAGQCELKLDPGAGCANNNQCKSNFCVDGVCCDGACDGECNYCNVEGKEGSCSPLAQGTQAGCGAYVCDGNGGTCPVTCGGDADCATSFFCVDGQCALGRGLGGACSKNDDCLSNFCADGVCCNARCDGSCETCTAEGRRGECTFVTGQPAAGREACLGKDACAGSCDGTQAACAYPGLNTVCEEAACAANIARTAGTCDGFGQCARGAPRECENGCDGAVCAGGEEPTDKPDAGTGATARPKNLFGCSSSGGTPADAWSLAVLTMAVAAFTRRRSARVAATG